MKKVLFMLFSFYAFSMVAQSGCIQPFVWDTIHWAAQGQTPPPIRFFNASGHEYSQSDLMLPQVIVSECQVGIFSLTFDDPLPNFNFFSDPQPIPATTAIPPLFLASPNGPPQTMGELRQRVTCQVFQDLSNFLLNVNKPNGLPGDMGRVRILISGQPLGGPNNAIMMAYPIFVLPSNGGSGGLPLINGLILDTEAQKTVLSGIDSYNQYPLPLLNTGNANNLGIMHGRIEVEPTIDWYYNFEDDDMINERDFYGVMLHEALHNLGIATFQFPIPIGQVFFDRYMRFWAYNDGPTFTPFTQQVGGVWTANTAPAPFSNCNTQGSYFFQGIGEPWQELSDDGHVTCDPASFQTTLPCTPFVDYVMSPCVGLGRDYLKRHPHEREKNILCDIGYQFEPHTNGLPEYGFDYTFDPSIFPASGNINNPYAASCEPPCAVAAVSDILSTQNPYPITVSPLDNDGNGASASLSQLILQTTNAGTFTQNGNQFTFTPDPSFTGWAVFSYVPQCANGQDAGTAFVFIEVVAHCDCPTGATAFVVGDPTNPITTMTDLTTSDLFTFNATHTIPDNSCITVFGELNINAPFTIPQGSYVMMMPGARITMHQNLTIEPNVILHGCNQMWEGIAVRKGTTLTMTDSRIEDANNAVWVFNNATIDLRNNRFHANNIGLRFEELGNTAALNITILDLIDNVFECTGATLLPPFATNTISLVGIMSRYYNLLISQRNTFRDMRYGILSRNGNLIVRNCLFAHIRNNTNPTITEGIAIFQGSAINTLNTLQVYGDNTDNTLEFDDCRVAIQGVRQHTGIFNNNMANVDMGVSVLLSHNSSHRIYNNDIQCNRVGIDFLANNGMTNLHIRNNVINAGTPTIMADAGIRMQAGISPSTNLYIYDNVVNQDFATVGYSITNFNNLRLSNNIANLSCTQPNTGFYLNLSPGALLSCNRAEAIPNCNTPSAGILLAENYNTSLECNHTENGRWGLYFANYTSTLPNLIIRGNEIGTHETGLRYMNSVNNLSQSLQGNLWTGTYSNAGAELVGNNFVGNEYNIDSYTSGNSFCPPSVSVNSTVYPLANLGSQLWFIAPNTGTTFECSNSSIVCNPNITSLTGGGTSPNDYELIEGEIQYGSYPEESEWAARRELYNRILNDSTLLQDSLLAAFFYSYQDSSEGQYQEVSYRMDEAFRLQPVTEAQLEMLHTQSQTWGDSLIVLDSLLQTTQDTASYLPLIRNVRLTINSLQTQYESILQGIETLRNNTFDYLQTENGLLPSNELYEQNEQIVNEIYLSTIARGNTDFTQQQVDDLANIANQCPLSGGNAVYKARSLYTIISGNSYYNDELLCMQAGVQYKQSQPKQIEKVYEIYPNPTDNVIQIKQMDNRKGNGNIEIRDSYNRFLLSKSIAEDENAWEINTSSLASGVYFLTVNRKGQTSYVQKVIIIR